jgi:glucosyl-dolichyl phosphate glucuronosyltransferase
MEIPKITVCVCVYNGQGFIKRCLESLLKQSYGNMELLVIDDGSFDNTPNILRGFSDKVTACHNDQNLGLMASRNKGARMANSEIIAYTDADCIAKENWVEELVKSFALSKDIVIAGGKVVDPVPTNYWGLVMKGTNFLTHRSGYFKKVIGCNMALRRDFVLNHEFDQTLKNYGDETDLCMRARKQGYKIYYQDSAEVIHYHRNRFSSLIRQRCAMGVANYYVRLKNREFPFVSIKSIDLVFAVVFFLLWTCGILSFLYFALFSLLYIGRVTYEDCRTKRKKICEVIISFPGKIVVSIVEDFGYLWGILWIIYVKKVNNEV